MKIMFLFQGLPHYSNYLLNRLNDISGLEVINVVPAVAKYLGQGVYETEEDIQYKLYRLEEYPSKWGGSFFRNFSKLVQKERPDVLVLSTPHLIGLSRNLPVLLLVKLLGIRIILKSIPFRVPTYEQTKSGLSIFSRTYFRMLMNKRVLRLPDGYVNYIDDAYRVYGSYGVPRNKIFVTCNSPDTDRLLAIYQNLSEKSIEFHPHRFIHVGRLVEWKRVDLLLIALSGLKKKYPDANMLVIGEGPQEENLKRLSRTLGVEDSVEFLGGIYDPLKLGEYLMSSAVYVLAGMGGISINEAMCFGRPIICSVADGTEKSLVKEGVNGFYFQEGDSLSLLEKIDALFAQPDLVKKMGQNSLDIIRSEINVHTVIDRYLRAFEEVTGKKI